LTYWGLYAVKDSKFFQEICEILEDFEFEIEE